MSKKEELEKVSRQIQKTKPLYKGTKNPVPGEGNPNAQIMFIGEAPGYWEDQKGRPFVGQAGRLLEQLLASIDLARKDVFIGNLVHWRPPGNRDPTPPEIKFCQGFVDRQIEIINPKLVVTLGRFSLGKFLPDAKISSVHGKPQRVEWKGKELTVLPLFHPAAGLRSDEVMQNLREDFLKILELLKKEQTKVEQKSFL